MNKILLSRRCVPAPAAGSACRGSVSPAMAYIDPGTGSSWSRWLSLALPVRCSISGSASGSRRLVSSRNSAAGSCHGFEVIGLRDNLLKTRSAKSMPGTFATPPGRSSMWMAESASGRGPEAPAFQRAEKRGRAFARCQGRLVETRSVATADVPASMWSLAGDWSSTTDPRLRLPRSARAAQRVHTLDVNEKRVTTAEDATPANTVEDHPVRRRPPSSAAAARARAPSVETTRAGCGSMRYRAVAAIPTAHESSQRVPRRCERDDPSRRCSPRAGCKHEHRARRRARTTENPSPLASHRAT